MTVKSTYNFVPAPEEKEVFKPGWANDVSHDIPFSDGESGEIELKITAETPIFIRNGHAEGDKELFDKQRKRELPNPTKDQLRAIERYLSFSNINQGNEKKFFIPGSSLKGMIRNVLEIISRGRMTRVDDHRHAVRQIMRPRGVIVDEGYELKNQKEEIQAGWLIHEDDQSFIVDCGSPYKIRYTDLDMKLGSSFEDKFGAAMKSNMKKDFSARTAKYKYENVININNLVQEFEEHPLDENGQGSWVSDYQTLNYVRFVNNGFKGTIVCVGQASDYSARNPRKGEYVFKGDKKEQISAGNRYKVPDEIMDNFRFVNRDNTSEELDDWGYWKNKKNEGIPVFYRKASNKDEVKDMGLTFMYKEPAKFSVKKVSPINTYAPENNDEYDKDLPETIFGYTNKENSLKGRVYFSNAILQNTANVLPQRKVVLSKPRSSFFPFYLKQEGNNGKTTKYNTYNTEKSELSGFKRYPVMNDNIEMDEAKLKKDMITEFKPLGKGSLFFAKLRFHNLRTAEIGALISALTFHETVGTFYHNFGFAKSLGYGKVKIKIDTSNLKFNNNVYLKSFENEITKKDTDWHHSQRIKELLAMAYNPNVTQTNMLKYFDDVQEFQKIKNNGYYLEPYSTLSDSYFSFKNHFQNEENEKQEKEKARQQELKEEQLRLEKEQETNDFNRAKETNTVEALQSFTFNHPDSDYNKQVDILMIPLRENKKKQKVEDAQKEDFVSSSPNFDDVKKWAVKILKIKNFAFVDRQKEQLQDAIKESFEIEYKKNDKKNAFMKKKKPAKFNDYPWTDIIRWIGTEKAKALYKELIGI